MVSIKGIVAIAMTACLFLAQTVHAKSFGSSLCKSSEKYTCYTAKKGDSWKMLFPDETERDLVKRINRMNTGLYRGLTIAIPANDSLNPLDFAPFPLQIDAPGKKLVLISKSQLAFGAYDSDGSLQYWGPVSTGKGYCPDVGRRCGTPNGKYAIYRKHGAGCKSTKFPVGKGGAPMPYCMFFNGGFAMHGSPTVPGYHASHGCVRMFTSDAKWLNNDFSDGESVSVVIKN